MPTTEIVDKYKVHCHAKGGLMKLIAHLMIGTKNSPRKVIP